MSEIELLRREIDDRSTFQDIVSKSHKIRRILDILPDIAASDCTVLIEGPTGSGKELVPKAIHNLSKRAKRKLVAINCGALPDILERWVNLLHSCNLEMQRIAFWQPLLISSSKGLAPSPIPLSLHPI